MGRDHAYECESCGSFYGGLSDPDSIECPYCGAELRVSSETNVVIVGSAALTDEQTEQIKEIALAAHAKAVEQQEAASEGRDRQVRGAGSQSDESVATPGNEGDPSIEAGGYTTGPPSEGPERCGGRRVSTTVYDDRRGSEFNHAPDSIAGASVLPCPGCPDCEPDSPAEYDGEICWDCDKPLGYVWNAPDELWNSIVGGPGAILCATCFVARVAVKRAQAEADYATLHKQWRDGQALILGLEDRAAHAENEVVATRQFYAESAKGTRKRMDALKARAEAAKDRADGASDSEELWIRRATEAEVERDDLVHERDLANNRYSELRKAGEDMFEFIAALTDNLGSFVQEDTGEATRKWRVAIATAGDSK